MKTTHLAKAAAPIYAAAVANLERRPFIRTADQAKLIRAALKDAFPGVTFSVRSDGSAIRVSWVDGPKSKDVDAITSQYRGGGFDGMIDMAYSVTRWLAQDGTVSLARSEGTTGSAGVHEERIGSAHHPSAVEVQFMADYVSNSREHSKEARINALEFLRANYGPVAELQPAPQFVEVTRGSYTSLNLSHDPHLGNEWLSCAIRRHLEGNLLG